MSESFLFPVGAGMTTPRLSVRFAVKIGLVFIFATQVTTSEVVAKGASLQISLYVRGLPRLTAVVYSLGPLPCLDSQEKEESLNKDNAPFPANTCVLEDDCVQARNVDDGEHGDKACDDSPEQELVAPGVNDPLREVSLALRLHAKEGSAHVDHFPGQEERKPGQAGKGRGASAEDNPAIFGELIVAVVSDVGSAIAKTVKNKDEGGEAEGRHPKTVDNHIDQKFGCKNTLLQLGGC